MFSRNSEGFTKAKAITFSQSRYHGAGFGLVANENDVLVKFANTRCKFLVSRCDTCTRINDEQNDVGLKCCHFRLVTHAGFERTFAGFIQSSGIIQGKGQLAQATCPFTTIAGYTWRIINNGDLLPNQPVEQRGFTNIGPAQNRDNGGH